MKRSLKKFLDAQVFKTALLEIRKGKRTRHWVWFVFPRLTYPGVSPVGQEYALIDLEHASRFLRHPVLRHSLIELSEAVLWVRDKEAVEIFGSPWDEHLHASMTVFANAEGTVPVFRKVIDKYFNGEQHPQTLEAIFGKPSNESLNP